MDGLLASAKEEGAKVTTLAPVLITTQTGITSVMNDLQSKFFMAGAQYFMVHPLQALALLTKIISALRLVLKFYFERRGMSTGFAFVDKIRLGFDLRLF